MEISASQMATLKRVSRGALALIGPANGAGPRPAKARPARGRLTSATDAVLCMVAGLPARGPRKARRASRQSSGNTDEGQRPSQRPTSRYGRTYAQLRQGCALTGLFRQLNLICGADVTLNRLMSLEPMKGTASREAQSIIRTF